MNKNEINGIADGLRAKQKNYDSLDITALNAMEELVFYYVPQLMDKEKQEAEIIKRQVIAALLLQRAVTQKMERL